MANEWTDTEDAYLDNHYGKRNIKLMVYELDRSSNAIYRRAWEKHLTKRGQLSEEKTLIATGGTLEIIGARMIHRMV